MRNATRLGWLTKFVSPGTRTRHLSLRRIAQNTDLRSESLESRDLLTGNFVSSFQIGAGSNDSVQAMFVDSAGNSYLTGYFSGSVDFDPGPGTEDLDAGSADSAIWRSNGDTTPNTADWSGSGFGSSQNTANVGEWRIIDGAESPTRDEKIVVGVRTSGVISGEIYSNGSWSSLPFSIVSGAASNQHGFDVVYDNFSGLALLVWTNGSSGTNNVSFRTWNGTSWSAAQTITAPLAGVATHISLAASRNSSVILLQVTTSTSQDYAIFWNGTAWVNGTTLGTTTVAGTTDAAGAIESFSGHGLAVYDNALVGGNLEYRTFVNGTWSTAFVLAPPVGVSANDVAFVSLVSDPSSDRIALGVLTDANEIWFAIWDGNGWTADLVATTTASANDTLSFALHSSGIGRAACDVRRSRHGCRSVSYLGQWERLVERIIRSRHRRHSQFDGSVRGFRERSHHARRTGQQQRPALRSMGWRRLGRNPYANHKYRRNFSTAVHFSLQCITEN